MERTRKLENYRLKYKVHNDGLCRNTGGRGQSKHPRPAEKKLVAEGEEHAVGLRDGWSMALHWMTHDRARELSDLEHIHRERLKTHAVK